MAKMRSRLKDTGPRHFVRQWRKYRHLTQEQLAERIQTTHGAISQLETGRTNYTQGMLEALADALMCEPADLLMRDPTQDQMIWSLWDKLGEAQKRQAVRFIQAISEDKAA
jgi:transcriptional regulator with XRE-family HTH domain